MRMELEDSVSLKTRIDKLLSSMTLAEKIGQMSQFNCDAENLHQSIRDSRVGSVINEVDVATVNHFKNWLLKKVAWVSPC